MLSINSENEKSEVNLFQEQKVNQIVKSGNDFSGIQEHFDTETVQDVINFEEDNISVDELIAMDDEGQVKTNDQSDNDIIEIVAKRLHSKQILFKKLFKI